MSNDVGQDPITLNDIPETVRHYFDLDTCQECGSATELGEELCGNCAWLADATSEDAARDDERARLSQGAK